jgi:hypothetical protein
VLSDVRVEKIAFEGTRAAGVTGRVVGAQGRPGVRVRVRAAEVVVACGALQTPALLGRSGFRSPSGMLGRNLSLHPNAKVLAVFDEEVRGWEGVHQAYQVREFQDEGLVLAAVNVPPGVLAFTLPHFGPSLARILDDYPRTVTAGVLVEDTSVGRVRLAPGGRPVVFYGLSDLDASRLVRGVGLLAEALFAAGARRVIPPFARPGELRSMDDVRRLFRSPVATREMEVLTVHLMGTARMGQDPSWAVTDSFGSVHGARRLRVCDASLFPTPLGVNPAETIHALATRNAHHLLDDFKGASR